MKFHPQTNSSKNTVSRTNRSLSASSKRVRVGEVEAPVEEFELELKDENDVPYRVTRIPFANWIGGKKEALPWTTYERLRQVCFEDGVEPMEFYRCLICLSATKITGPSSEVNSNYIRHLALHFGSSSFLKGAEKEDENVARKMVLAWASTGLPYYPLTDSSSELHALMKDHDLGISPNTFRKILNQLFSEGVDSIERDLAGNYLAGETDASPSKARDEYHATSVHFINAEGVYNTVNLGIRQSAEKLDGQGYTEYIDTLCRAFEISTPFKRRKPLDEGGSSMVAFTTDLGVGGHQAGKRLVGVSATLGCVLHGQNNILESLAKEVPPKAPGEKTTHATIYSVIQELRKQHRGFLKLLNARVPGNPTDNRWNRAMPAMKYLLDNREIIRVLDLTGLDDALYTMMEGYLSVTNDVALNMQRHQADAPGATFTTTLDLLSTVSNLVKKNLYKTVGGVALVIPSTDFNPDPRGNIPHIERCRRHMLARLGRRFFSGEFEALNAFSISGDRTRKENLLSNKFILVAFALSPLHDFSFLGWYELATPSESAALARRARDALGELLDFVAPNARGIQLSSSSSSTAPSTPPSFFNDPFATPATGPVPDALRGIESSLTAFRAMADSSFKTFTNTRANVESRTGEQDARLMLLSALWSAAGASPTIRKLLRIVWAIPLTSVCSERDFAHTQHVLTEKRLRMSHQTLAGLLMVKLNRRYLSESPPSVASRKQAPITSFFKSTTRFTPNKTPPASAASSSVSTVASTAAAAPTTTPSDPSASISIDLELPSVSTTGDIALHEEHTSESESESESGEEVEAVEARVGENAADTARRSTRAKKLTRIYAAFLQTKKPRRSRKEEEEREAAAEPPSEDDDLNALGMPRQGEMP